MRISTAQYFESSAVKYQDNFSNIVKTQEQVTSGVRIQTAADDPVGAARLLLLQQQKDMLGQFSGNMTSLKNSLTNEESVLDSVNTALQSARELALQAGNGGISDADRKSVASEIGEIEAQVLGLLNSKDSSGQYLFSGSKTSTPPYVRNNDGTYTYQGDETPLSLQVSDTLSIASNDTGKTILEGATNSVRTQATWQPPTVGDVNDNKVAISAGLLTSNSAYNKNFAAGQPYSVTFTSSTQYTVTDAGGNDVTAEIPGNGTFDSKKEGASSINLRGVTFDISLNLKDTDTDPDAAVKDHVFTLQTKPDSFNASRTPSNTSTAQVTGASVTNHADYTSTFPNSGAVIKFTSATDYEVYAQPMSANSKAIASGVMAGTSITAAGVTFDITGTPNPDDQFVVGASSHRSQSALQTLSQLRKALETPADGDVVAQLKLKDSVNSAISNLANASEQVDIVRGSIGARLNSIDIQSTENISLGLANASTQASIADTDIATASIDLAFQQSLLQASQLSFVKIAQLSLFNKL
jgi:flagellar hook-associated protein 3 FlgL